jgi:hypothetical protein
LVIDWKAAKEEKNGSRRSRVKLLPRVTGDGRFSDVSVLVQRFEAAVLRRRNSHDFGR